jgi:anti-sigma-K factor RskA
VPDDLTPTTPHDDPDFDPDFENVEAILRDLDLEDLERVEPPASVWEGIESSLDRASSAVATTRPDAAVVSLDERRRRWTSPALAVAAAIAVIVAGAVILSQRGSDDTTVARATLEFDETSFDPLGAEATAEVSLREADGVSEIDVDEATLPGTLGEPADLEIWMIEADADGNVVDIVALGLVDPDDPSSFAVPPGIDPARFTVVDISIEPRDGDAQHSGRSILRGELAPA